MIWLLVWLFLGMLIVNFMWVLRDLERKIVKEYPNIDEDDLVRGYVRGTMFGLILGPFAVIALIINYNKAMKRLEKLNN